MRDGSKQSDIYMSKLNENGKWGDAVRLPETVNSSKEEESVLIHPDGKTLYFGSKGHIGMGGTDLFMSRMDEKGNWGKAINLGYPINTHFDEHSLMVSPDGEIGFMASDREGGFGDLDIYYFPLPEHLRPTKTIYFEGLVYDIETKNPLPGKFKLIDMSTGKEIVYSEADPLTGEFIVTLPVNREYVLNVSYPNYNFFSKNFNMKNSEEQESFKMDVPLVPLTSDVPIVLNNVFFDLSKSSLRMESFIELEKLREFLAMNQFAKIEIGGHTDTRGDAVVNQKLSEDRAKSVYDYLISKGIAKERLSYKGYGETMPVFSDAQIGKLTIEAEIEAAHQLNRRTEYKIIK
jgi:outer membrane protein OmpA-like peptidoglycan-associated protein